MVWARRQPKLGEMGLAPNGNNRKLVSNKEANVSIRQKRGYPRGLPLGLFFTRPQAGAYGANRA